MSSRLIFSYMFETKIIESLTTIPAKPSIATKESIVMSKLVTQ